MKRWKIKRISMRIVEGKLLEQERFKRYMDILLEKDWMRSLPVAFKYDLGLLEKDYDV